jgi:hypothetical protein
MGLLHAFKENRLYKELAEKEESLMLAAQFGKTLLDEKEQLELQIDSLKKEYQNRIEVYIIRYTFFSNLFW